MGAIPVETGFRQDLFERRATVAAVYDTNVLVSGIGFGGKLWDCLLLSFVGNAEMVTSEPVLSEFERVLGYDRLPFTGGKQETFPRLIRNEATVIDPHVEVTEFEDDPDDDIFLECATAAGAEYLVFGNDHVLDIGSFRGTEVVSPDEFLRRY
jgi:predicted nucleic acid-binding protein